MNSLITRDGTEIHYRDWGEGRPVVFCHGWALSGDMWEAQMCHLAARGHRCIAHDRRGFGRSSQPWGGYGADVFADDLAMLVQSLDLIDAVLVGFGMGGAEILRYIARHGSGRVGRLALVSAIPPGAAVGPAADPAADLAANRPGQLSAFARALYGRLAEGEDDVRAWTSRQVMQAGLPALRATAGWAQADLRPDLARVETPALLLHGDADAILPYSPAVAAAAGLVSQASVEVFAGAPHGIFLTHAERLNARLLAFIAAD